MRLLLLAHGFNSLTQRLHVELRERGHDVSVEFDIADSVTEEAVALWRPDVVVASFLKRRIPEAVWRRVPCLVVHPGLPGDGGPSALDHAILRGERDWGVTVLQATADLDAGPVWAHAAFPMRAATKGDLYRGEVTDAAVSAVLAALDRLAAAGFPPDGPPPGVVPPPARTGTWHPLVRAADRRIDWTRDDAATVLRTIRSADGHPGVVDALFGQPCRLFDAHPATADAVRRACEARGRDRLVPGEAAARRGPAVLVGTADGLGVWIGHVRREATGTAPSAERPVLKLAATRAFETEAAALPDLPVPWWREASDPGAVPRAAEFDELDYREWGLPGGRVGWLAFDLHNGAVGVRQCARLREAIAFARGRDTQVLLLAGGAAFFGNGIHLHEIEAAAQREGDSAADASWAAIQAIDDVVRDLVELTDRLTVSVLRGNAGAGGCFLALAADEVWAAPGVVLNPHYKNMGNLYGSEYWTYLLPRRLARRVPPHGLVAAVRRITQGRLPVGAAEAVRLGLVDAVLDGDDDPADGSGLTLDRLTQVNARAVARATALVSAYDRRERVEAGQRQRQDDEARTPLAAYREQELARMRANFYGFDPSYHVARHHFVTRKPQAFTPRHLAVHRDPAARRDALARGTPPATP